MTSSQSYANAQMIPRGLIWQVGASFRSTGPISLPALTSSLMYTDTLSACALQDTRLDFTGRREHAVALNPMRKPLVRPFKMKQRKLASGCEASACSQLASFRGECDGACGARDGVLMQESSCMRSDRYIYCPLTILHATSAILLVERGPQSSVACCRPPAIYKKEDRVCSRV